MDLERVSTETTQPVKRRYRKRVNKKEYNAWTDEQRQAHKELVLTEWRSANKDRIRKHARLASARMRELARKAKAAHL